MSDITISPQHSHGTCYITIYKASVTYWTLTKQNEELAEALIASNRNDTETSTMTNLINVFTESCARGKNDHGSQMTTTQGPRTHRFTTHNPTDQEIIVLGNMHRQGHMSLIIWASTDAED